MSNKTMEDYLKEGLNNETPSTNISEMLIEALTAVHTDTTNNFELIKNINSIIKTILDLIEVHQHCPDCGKVYIPDSICTCKEGK